MKINNERPTPRDKRLSSNCISNRNERIRFQNENSILILIIKMKNVQIQEFDEVFGRICSEGKKCVMIFTSEKDQKGEYWCPSCEKIVPFYPKIEKQCKQQKLEVYRFLCGDKEVWNEDEHKFRNNPQLKIVTIPTMGIFDGQKLRATLNGDEIVEKVQRDLMFQFKDK